MAKLLLTMAKACPQGRKLFQNWEALGGCEKIDMRTGRGGEVSRRMDRLQGVEATQSGIVQGSANRTRDLVLFHKFCLLSCDKLTEEPIGKSFVFSSIPKQNTDIDLVVLNFKAVKDRV